MLIPILIGLAVVIALFIVIVATRPSDFRVARSMAIAAPAEVVFAQVNDFHNWEEWSPWAKLDPNARNTYGGAAAGVGAKFAWSGNAKVGEGNMTITQSRPNELVGISLEFIKPFKANNMAEFTFKEQDGETIVNWSMSGKNNFIGKALGLFINCDKMCGAMFEKGLAQMKSLSETTIRK
jgi:hypothetical protein